MSPRNFLTRTVLLLFLFAVTDAFDDVTVNPDLNARLKLAATNVDKHALLPGNSDWIFDFRGQESWTYNPGSVITANAATFPAMQPYGMTLSVLNLGPCAMLPPHLHQRATNIVIAITGNTTTWMVNENGARTVETVLLPYMMTIFPTGSLHTMQNNGCDNATLISALNSEDTGTLNILNGLFAVPAEMVQAAFGNADLNVEDMGKQIPDPGTGAALGSPECLKRCSLES